MASDQRLQTKAEADATDQSVRIHRRKLPLRAVIFHSPVVTFHYLGKCGLTLSANSLYPSGLK